jgi:glycogen synthase
VVKRIALSKLLPNTSRFHLLMKILFSSYAFRPSVGGIETVSAILADQFVAAGHEVQLITETPGEEETTGTYQVTRRPSLTRLNDLLRWADLFFQNNVSLRSLLPALLARKRTIVVHQTWIRNTRGEIGWNDRLKRAVLGRVTNVAISAAVADDFGKECRVVPNPYRDDLFRLIPGIKRSKTLVFVGRLVSDKGVDLLLRALGRLRSDGLTPDLTIVGDGPDMQSLRELTRELQLQGQIVFAGRKSGEELARLLNEHRIMVIPSRWPEPFGIVALEGIACGCVVVASAGGGLKDAVGRSGITFENGKEEALAESLRRLLLDSELEKQLRAAGEAHLRHFTAGEIARAYLQLIKESA